MPQRARPDKVRLCGEPGPSVLLDGFATTDITPTMAGGEIIVRGWSAGAAAIEVRDIQECDPTACP
jgi:hypothetical protein